MPIINPLTDEQLLGLLGKDLYAQWQNLMSLIFEHYDLDMVWHSAAKGTAYECKLRKGSKTIISLFPNYPKANTIGVMIIFGKDDREKFDVQKQQFTATTISVYDEAKTYRDGKWVMFEVPSDDLMQDLLPMLAIKRNPNK